MPLLMPVTGLVAMAIAASSALSAAPLDPQLARGHWDQAIVHERQSDLPGALREARLALASDPTRSEHYEKVATISGTLLLDALHHGDTAEAKRRADELSALGAQFVQFKAQADAMKRLWPYAPLTMAPAFQLRYGQALFLTGHLVEAESYLTEAAKAGLLGSEAHVWLHVIYERRDDQAAMAALADKPWIRFRAASPVYKALKEWVVR